MVLYELREGGEHCAPHGHSGTRLLPFFESSICNPQRPFLSAGRSGKPFPFGWEVGKEQTWGTVQEVLKAMLDSAA